MLRFVVDCEQLTMVCNIILFVNHFGSFCQLTTLVHNGILLKCVDGDKRTVAHILIADYHGNASQQRDCKVHENGIRP